MGPVRRGKPVKSKAGKTFRKFIDQLQAIGYDAEWRELVAANYGAPTTRKRFFLIARCDGKPIVWPNPTHAPASNPEVKRGEKLPWRSAAEIIDWSLPCPSIFETREDIKEKYGLFAQRPLRPNTMRRVIRGVDKFVIKNTQPYLVGNRAPALIQYHTERSERVRGQGVEGPLMTVDAANRYGMSAVVLTKYYSGDNAQSTKEPLHTVTTKDREGVTIAHMAKFYGTEFGEPITRPLSTVTSSGANHAVITTTVVRVQSSADVRRWPEIRELLNTYCGYDFGPEDVVLFQIGGAWYFMADIGLRMLTPRELYRANGFPNDYIIDRDYEGNAYGKSKQVARCGNAVPPPFATALVRANLPEWCGKTITTMEELEKEVAV